MPPFHAGMEPSALPDFSPPSGVRSLPRRSASAGESAALAASAAANDQAVGRKYFAFMRGKWPGLEGIFDGRGDVVAVAEEIVAPGAEEVHITQLKRPFVLEREIGADGESLAAMHEISERQRGVA